MPNPPIVVVGSLNLDRTLNIRALPHPGETQTALGYTQGAGGKGANQDVAAARMGARTFMLGCTGDDADGTFLIDSLTSADVDTSAIVRLADHPTGSATILLTPTGQNSILVVPGANAGLTPEHLHLHVSLLLESAAILIQLETPLPVLAETLSIAALKHVPVILDPAPAAILPQHLLQQLTWFTPNETEAAFYAQSFHLDPTASPESLCHAFQKFGPRNILLKLGAKGAVMLTENGQLTYVPAPSVHAIDTTGAGDTLNGAFAAALAEGQPAEQALHFAITAASLSTMNAGAQSGIPTRQAVLDFQRLHP